MRKFLLTLALLLPAVFAWSQSTIKVQAPNLVSLDEQFQVVFVIEGEHKPKDFQWSPGDAFQLVWGPQKGSYSSISIVNGKTTKTVQNSYTYILLPKTTGSFQLSAATAMVEGSAISSRPVTIEVVGNGAASTSGQQPSQGGNTTPGGASQGSEPSGSSSTPVTKPKGADVFMSFSVSKTRAVVGEPLTAVLKLYKHQRTEIAGFEGAKFPTFNGFWSQEMEAPANISFHREKVGDNIYDAAVIRSWSIIPQKAGTLTIDPAELVCLVNESRGAKMGNSIFDDFFDDQYVTNRKRIVSRAYSVQVSALPSGGGGNFSGAVGEFGISARVSKDSLKTHEAATIRLTITGKGNLSMVEAPKVTFPPDFETYDVKTTGNTDRAGTSGSKVFEYPFIPRSHGDFRILPIVFSYYNPSTGKYATARTDTLRLSVAPGASDPASLESSSPAVPSVDRKGVKDLGSDIRFVKTGSPALKRQSSFFVGKPAYYALLGILALAALLFYLGYTALSRRRADVRGTRNRKAARMAMLRLKTAFGYLKEGIPSAFYEELHRSLLGFVGDRLAMDMADQNKDNIVSALCAKGVGAPLAGEFTALLDECEEARYSPSAGDSAAMQQLYERSVRVISSIDADMKGHKSAGKGSLALLALLLLGPLTAVPARAALSDAELKGLWNSGMEAYNAGQYDLAAQAWQKMIDEGIVSAQVYYNAGNAWFKEEQYARAILCYERAMKADPSDRDIRYNLEFARGFVIDKIDAVPEFFLKTWARSVCYVFSSNVWAVLSLGFFAGFLVLLLLFLLGGSPAAKRGGFFGGIVALLLALSCFGNARWIRHDGIRRDAAVVMTPVVSVRSAPSADTSTELFLLHEGTRVEIKGELSGYNNIILPDGREGWIAAKDIEII